MARAPRFATRPITGGLCRSLSVCLLVLAAGAAQSALASGGKLVITVVDRDSDQQIPCRMHLRNAAGRPRKPGRVPFWHDHFVFDGKITLKLPVGDYTFEIRRGPEYLKREGYFTINSFADDAKRVTLRRFVDMSAHGWWSGDLQVCRPVRDIELLMAAEDLHVAELLTWQNDKSQWSGKPLPKQPLVCFDDNRCYHLMAGSHARNGTELLFFHLPAPLKLAGSGEYPPPMKYLTEARRHTGAWVDLSKPFWWDLPMLVAAGEIDSLQLAHSHICRQTAVGDEADGKPRDKRRYPSPWGNAQWSQQIYFQLIECGLRIPPTAGSGSGTAPNPVGYNRVYVHLDGEFAFQKWFDSLRAGRVVVTNGPLMRPTVHGRFPGHVFRAEEGEELDFEIGLTLSTAEPISYLELIKNGRVEHSIRFDDYASSGRLPKLHFRQPGWFLVRAVTDLPKTYRFAITGPYYVEIGGRRRISKRAAQFFLDWVYQRARRIEVSAPARRREVLGHHRRARDFWQERVSGANAE